MSKKAAKKKRLDQDQRLIATNKRARHEYDIEEVFELGIALQGTEVKSLRAGNLSFKDAYAAVVENELWLFNLHIDEFSQGNRHNHNPTRKRKLLAHKREILKLLHKTRQDGYTLIPLRLYFKKSWVKVEVGLCRGKKRHDQRQDIAKRDAKRQIEQAMRRRR